MKTPFSTDELSRYARHFVLRPVGREGQERLKNSSVLCVGAGGLGAPVLLYLAAAGVGKIGIIDHDAVDLSNLQRQVLFDEESCGKPKVEVAQQRLKKLNPNSDVVIYHEKLVEANVLSVLSSFDVIVDCTDNFPVRYLINDTCVRLKKPYVFSSVFQFEGQCSVFCAENGPCYRCLFETPPPVSLIPNCAEGGVLGVLPGIMGSIQATEVIKLLLNIGKPLIGRLLTVNALTMQFKEFELSRSKSCSVCSTDSVLVNRT